MSTANLGPACKVVVSSSCTNLSCKWKSSEIGQPLVNLGKNGKVVKLKWTQEIVSAVSTQDRPMKTQTIGGKSTKDKTGPDERPLLLVMKDLNDASRAVSRTLLPDLDSDSRSLGTGNRSLFPSLSDTLSMEREWAIALSDPLPAIVTKILKERPKHFDENFVWMETQPTNSDALEVRKGVPERQEIRKGVSARQRRLKVRQERIAKQEEFTDSKLLSITPIANQESAYSRRVESGQDAVTSYLSQIGKVKLLTRREEVLLSERFQSARKLIAAKDQLKEELGQEPTNAEWAKCLNMEVTELLRHVREGVMAKNKLVLANLRLVVSVAKNYTKCGMELPDLIQAGTVGLQRGVEKFDPSKGFKMSTYVHWWIRQSINRALAVQGLVIRVPMHAHETWSQIRAAKNMLRISGQEPSIPKLVEYLGIPEKKIRNALRVHRNIRSFEEDIWNKKSPDDDGTSLHHFIADSSREASPWRTADEQHLKVEIRRLIEDTLDPREQEIVRSHFGIDRTDGLSMSMESISRRLGISRERGRQLESVALRRLRTKCMERELSRYLFEEQQ